VGCFLPRADALGYESAALRARVEEPDTEIPEISEDITMTHIVLEARELSASTEDALRDLVEEGIILPASEPRASLEEVLQELSQAWAVSPPEPGALARFLESRD